MIILTGASGGIGQELIGHLSEIDNVIGLYNKEPIHPLPGDSRITYEKSDLLNREGIEAFVGLNKNTGTMQRIWLTGFGLIILGS